VGTRWGEGGGGLWRGSEVLGRGDALIRWWMDANGKQPFLFKPLSPFQSYPPAQTLEKPPIGARLCVCFSHVVAGERRWRPRLRAARNIGEDVTRELDSQEIKEDVDGSLTRV